MSIHSPRSSNRESTHRSTMLSTLSSRITHTWITGCAIAASAALAFSVAAPRAIAQDSSETTPTTITTQMTSSPETVYTSNISGTERNIPFNNHWKFLLSDSVDAHAAAFDDSDWRTLNLPHDFSIEQDYSKKLEAESGYLPGGTGWYRKTFSVDQSMQGKNLRIYFDGVYMDATVWLNGHKLGEHHYGYTGFSFDLTKYLNFSGDNVLVVKAVNSIPSSRWYSGSGIYRAVNLLATEPVHVDLHGTTITSNNLASQHNGTVDVQVKTNVRNDSSTQRTVTLRHTIYKKSDLATPVASSTTQAQAIEPNSTATVTGGLQVTSPELWSLDNPALYTVRTEVVENGRTVDTSDSDYGFRWFNFDANTGFSLNGTNVKLQGVSMHHDQGSLGAAAYRRAIERQVEILLDMGVNSIRVTHNPAAQELIDVCNEKGMLLIEEAFDTWKVPKNGNSKDFARWFAQDLDKGNGIENPTSAATWAQFDLQSMVRRDINAPSVIMWSLGNEIFEGISGNTSDYPTVASKLIQWTQALDTSRPVTLGDNRLKGQSSGSLPNQVNAKIHEADGIVGGNYMGGGNYDWAHRTFPEWRLYGSETASAINSRGIYDRLSGGGRTSDKQLTSYDRSAVGWGAVASSAWYDVITRDFVAGEYVWTGFDYIGEPTPWNGISGGQQGDWPSPKSSYFGIIDTAGFPKDSYYLYRSQWNKKSHTLHVLPAWNENVITKDGQNRVLVNVYSDAASVELFFTPQSGGQRQSLGKKTFTKHTTPAGYTYQVYEGSDKDGTAHRNLYLQWRVPWAPGSLEAVAYDESGQVIDSTVGRKEVKTTDRASKLQASADRTEIQADGSDLSYVTVDVTDRNGNIVPDASNRVTFKVDGPGELVGVDNGSAPDHDSYKANNRKAFSGKVLAIVKSTDKPGTIRVTATADGLTSSEVTIQSQGTQSSGGQERTVRALTYSRNYYVKVGNAPQLPKEIEVRYSDGTIERSAVTWDDYDQSLIQRAGTFNVHGTAAGESVNVTVTMINEVAGLLNYSTTTQVGVVPTLAPSRPVVLPDGTVLDTSFPVEWKMPEASAFNSTGIVTVPGTASVFGKQFELTATVRVQEETLTLKDSVSSDALRLTQSVPEGKTSDTLDAVKDGSTVIAANDGGGRNPSAWSNYDYSQAPDPHREASITFEYATQLRLGQVVVHFFTDNWSARLPDANTTKIEVSDDGSHWTPVEARETIGSTKDRVTPYTFDFAPVNATFIRVNVLNKDVDLGNHNSCTGITEIEIKPAQGSFVTNTDASITSLNVNGTDLSAQEVAALSYDTPAVIAEVKAASDHNASITVLPAYENVVRIISESEDHNSRKVFEINLDTERQETADFDGRDIPVEKLTATTGSAQSPRGQEGPASNVLDGNTGTLWHTAWSPLASHDQLWIQFEMDEPTEIDAVRYLPRSGSPNGVISEYLVQVSNDGQNWTEAATGTWPNEDADWRIAEFAPVTAKYVRMTAVHSRGDSGNDKFASAAEMRVRRAPSRVDISDDAGLVDITVPSTLEVDQVNSEHPAMFAPDQISVQLRDGNTPLRYGIDYALAYDGNTDAGKATVTIRGIDGYTGTATREFTVIVAGASRTLTGIAVRQNSVAKTTYTEGDTFDPTGLILELAYSDDTSESLKWTAANKNVTFSPALTTKLSVSHTAVKVAYKGFTAVVPIIVRPAPAEGDVSAAGLDPEVVGDAYSGSLPEAVTTASKQINLTHQNGRYCAAAPATAAVNDERGSWKFVGWKPECYTDAQAATYRVPNTRAIKLPFTAQWRFTAATVEPEPQPETAVEVSTDAVQQGGEITVTARDFKPGHEVRFELHSDPVVLGTVVADNNGVATLTTSIPKDTPAGAHEIVAIDTTDENVRVSQPITVTEAPVDPNPDDGKDDGKEDPKPDDGKEDPKPDDGKEDPKPDDGKENPRPDDGKDDDKDDTKNSGQNNAKNDSKKNSEKKSQGKSKSKLAATGAAVQAVAVLLVLCTALGASVAWYRKRRTL